MGIYDIYSKRQKELRGEVPEVFHTDLLPDPLKVQIIHIIRDAVGHKDPYSNRGDNPKEAYKFIHNTLCREYGVFSLEKKSYNQSDRDILERFLLKTDDVEKAIDLIELAFKYIELVIWKNFQDYTSNTVVSLPSKEAIDELNHRFKEHGIGFQYEGQKIIRVDSTYAHTEITRPTINLLWNKKFHGANEEYMSAHEHFRHRRNKECLVDCLKAFESTMKIIASEKGWIYNEKDTAIKLIDICFKNELIPSFLQNQFSSLQNLLISGIPTIRNKKGGHGQGKTRQEVSDELAQYALNLCGSNIIFLIKQSGLI